MSVLIFVTSNSHWNVSTLQERQMALPITFVNTASRLKYWEWSSILLLIWYKNWYCVSHNGMVSKLQFQFLKQIKNVIFTLDSSYPNQNIQALTLTIETDGRVSETCKDTIYAISDRPDKRSNFVPPGFLRKHGLKPTVIPQKRFCVAPRFVLRACAVNKMSVISPHSPIIQTMLSIRR